tara:strand:- start:350 stop:691 length:342 start_codon:yes stop_codon:yes gene_type:complete
MIVHHPRLFRRDAWEAVGRHNESLTNAVDYDLFLKLSEVGTMHHVRQHLYSYRILETSTSRAKSDQQTANTHRVVQSALARQGLNRFTLHVQNPDYPRRYIFLDQRFVTDEIS